MIYLRKINSNKKVFVMLKTIGQNENEFKNDSYNMTYDQFVDWVKLMNDWSKGCKLPKDYCKQYVYILYDNFTPIGIGKLREKLNDRSRNEGGNIGYAISKQFRGSGYGKILFSLLLKKAKKLQIQELLATVKVDNVASKRVVEACGGKLNNKNDTWLYYIF